jgi:DNA-binding SARP family transcriptional activator
LLDATAVRVDVQQFDVLTTAAAHSEPAAALSLLQQACRLATHGLLEHEPYMSWAVRARTERHARVLDAALTGARLALQLDRPQEATRLARHATEVDPFAEEGWQALIESLGRSGRGAEARRAFRGCEIRLRELGERPDGHTRRLLADAAAVRDRV